MDVYQETERLARRFERAYPPKLAGRLRWWGNALGIEQSQLLRMIGLSARQAALARDTELEAVLDDPQLEQNAWLLEGNLVGALSLFRYDPRLLLERLRQSATEECEGATRDDDIDHLLEHMLQGGPDSLVNLLSYLVAMHNGHAAREEV